MMTTAIPVRAGAVRWLPVAVAAALTLAASPVPGEEDLSMAAALGLGRIVADRTDVSRYERVVLTIPLTATYRNPFDSREVRVDAEVRAPDGQAFRVPGFLQRPYRREVLDGREVLTPAGEATWQVRLSLPTSGLHTVLVHATDRSGTAAAAEPVTIRVRDADLPGFVRVSGSDRRYFATDRGESFFPVGANVCWAGARGTFDYDDWLRGYSAHGANFFRVWLSPEFTLALNTRSSGWDRINLGNAWRLDYVLDRCESLGLRVMLCLDSFNILRRQERQHGWFETAPWHRDMGGPIAEPREYFTHADSLRAYRDRLRYVVARYGYSTAVFAWEFWNEVDIIDQYDSALVTEWHRDMARFLRSIDPWRHLITTSTATPRGDPRLDALPELEFVQTHRYQAEDMAAILGNDRLTKKAAQDRPHFHGEFGISHSGQTTRETDPEGIHLHNGLYASVGQQQAGTPMTWWWDSYVHPRGLYPVFGAFSRWIAGYDFVAQGSEPLKATVTPLAPAPVRLGEAAFPQVRGSWSPAPFNEPVRVTAGSTGVTQTAPIASFLHGRRNHARLHNPITFELDVPQDTTFTVDVLAVSGHGGARLQVSLDGVRVRDDDFPDPDDTADTRTLTAFRGSYSIDLPAGQRTVLVENVGNDWIEVAGYRIGSFYPVGPVQLRVIGLRGRDRILAWFQNPAYTWTAVCVRGQTPSPCPPSRVDIPGVPPGQWVVEWWDTRGGSILRQENLVVAPDGVLSLNLPEVLWDAAVRMHLAGAPAAP